MSAYRAFLERKSQHDAGAGFAPRWIPDFLFDFQQASDRPVRIRRPDISASLRFAVFRRDDWACRYCGARPPQTELRIEHVLARAQGGDDHPDNLVTSCRECNDGKGSQLLNPSERPVGGPVLLKRSDRDMHMMGFTETFAYIGMDLDFGIDYDLIERAAYLLPMEELYAAVDEAVTHLRAVVPICGAMLSAGLYRRIAQRQTVRQQPPPPPSPQPPPGDASAST